ncbi:LamB/YcsF family protein [Limnochorda pilosa]|uniref:5-oxoprolinase subunit A n=1 Tax=Limnochorda pilosa TaxID=1555112 RepID=A0A0K2SLD0_LIMPI|nr:5-oxoprolinase subunit PxpA [Limnochorda pilosa]BAS27807.1 LamB/YcsF family protein [Limnochorda pilosa]
MAARERRGPGRGSTQPESAVVDLNADLGESFGPYTLGNDADILRWITSANVACGFHGGDPRVMRKTVALCRERGVAVGAHPSYPDRVGFGRRVLWATPDEVETDVVYQVGALLAFCRAEGVPLHHVKPHGALYNVAARDEETAMAVARAVRSVDASLLLYAPPGSALARAAETVRLRVALEGFVDRRYQPDGTLLSRREPGAVIHAPEEAAAQAWAIAIDRAVRARSGEVVPLPARTLCVHGDNPAALAILETVRATLDQAGILVAAP